jgi:hypothetical protein
LKEVVQWFEHHAARERRTPSLEDAFARNRFLPYAFYRLRFFLARAVLNWVLHVVGVWLLLGALSRRQFGLVALAHLGAAFASSAWWGCLEEMRERIRQLHRAGRMRLIPREVGRWLAFSLRLSRGMVVGGGLWIVGRALVGMDSLGFVEACLLSIIVRLAIEVPWRCYHSGLYAIRRIYRPLPAMVTVDLLGFFGLVVLWPLLGRWSFPVSSLLSSLLATGIGVYYANRSYRFVGLDPFQHVARRRGLGLDRESFQRLVAAGLAGGIMSLDALLVVVALTTAAWHGTSATLFVPLFLISPMIRAGHDWAQLFYFDLKRLETVPFGNLSQWLGERVFGLSWCIGLLFWAAACAAAAWSGASVGSLGLALLLFFHSRSLLAALQVRNFAEAAYAKLIGTGLLLFAGYLAASFAPGTNTTVLALAAANYGALLGLLARNMGWSSWFYPREPLLPAVWLQTLRRAEKPVRILAIQCYAPKVEDSRVQKRELAQGKARRLARLVARKLGRHGAVTMMHPGRILWFEYDDMERGALLKWVLVRAAGLAGLVGQTLPQPAGIAALQEARTLRLFDDPRRYRRQGHTQEACGSGYSLFRRWFPEGIAWTPGAPTDLPIGITPGQTRSLFADASTYLRDLHPNGRRSGLEVTALSAGKQLKWIFAVPRHRNRRARGRWRAVIRGLNLSSFQEQ